MAHATAKPTFSERLHWEDRIKPWLIRLLFAALGLLIGLYILAPMQTRAGDAYLPDTFTAIPTGIIEMTSVEGPNVLLPVRIADSSTTRASGFKGVGPVALDNTFLLYAQSRETTRSTYSLQGVRAKLEFAVIDAEGNVIGIQEALPDSERLTVTDKHRWVLAAKAGTFERYGVGVGSRLDPETIQKINL